VKAEDGKQVIKNFKQGRFIMKKFLILFVFLFSSTNLVAEDYFKALELFNLRKIEDSLILFKKVANKEGDIKRSDAMFNLAIIYDNGFGVPVDKTRALYYYEAASGLSNKYAQYNLGWKYYNGESVNKDVMKAFDLYKAAADFGHPRAMYNLANMYYLGVGTVKDLKMAYKMFLHSKIGGIGESRFFIDEISRIITPEELVVLNEEFNSLIEKKIPIPEKKVDEPKN
tara:strand:+ start:222 stop:902 length:681 start_codon:yes stop_codon:yes gene_type:complete